MIAQAFHEFEVVEDAEHRGAFGFQLLDEGAHLELRRVVERGRGLVEQQQARALDHGGGDVEAQLLAARERAGVQLPQAFVQIEVAQHALGLLFGAGALVGAVRFQRAFQHDVVGGLARQGVEELGDVAQLVGAQVQHLALRGLGQVQHAEALRVVQDAAALGQVCAPDAAQDGGLAAAAAPRDAHELARFDGEVDVLAPLHAPVHAMEQEGFGQAVDSEERHATPPWPEGGTAGRARRAARCRVHSRAAGRDSASETPSGRPRTRA